MYNYVWSLLRTYDLHDCTDGSSAVHQTAYSGEVETLALLLSLGGNGMLKVR